MRSRAAAYDEAYASLHRLGLPDILPTLHAAGVTISRTVLGGSHSVAVYPPIDSLTPLNPISVVDSIHCDSEVSLYIHIAFCETRCTFCHYAVDHYAGKGKSSRANDDEVAHYLDALKQELIFWGTKLARSSTVVSSIYIGGGTPLILEQEALHDIIRTIRGCYSILPGAEVCVEGSPLTITAPGGDDKLRYLKEQGVTRLSFGVQSFDDAVLKYAARGYKRDIPIRASLVASQIFENWNLDLIQGLYKGSPFEAWENLKVIAELRPPHLTWYHGRFADRPQGDWYKMESKHFNFEDEAATLFGRMLIWQEMAALGYHLSDGNRFVRDHQYIDPFKRIRTSASSDLLGVGASSYSHIGTKARNEDCRGYAFRNESNIRSYADCVLAGGVPIATGSIIDEGELLATSYATGLRYGRIENDDLRSIRKTKHELSRHYQELENKLRAIGILESYMDDNGRSVLRISALGRLFEDEVLALFFSPAVKRALARKASSKHELVELGASNTPARAL
jgi:coproporphyrinogen III oxidase-like Fe-S oxidoreductase